MDGSEGAGDLLRWTSAPSLVRNLVACGVSEVDSTYLRPRVGFDRRNAVTILDRLKEIWDLADEVSRTDRLKEIWDLADEVSRTEVSRRHRRSASSVLSSSVLFEQLSAAIDPG